MPFLLPFVATILQTSSLLTDKAVLSLKNFSYKTYLRISFPLTFLIMLVIFLIVRPPLSFSMLMGTSGLLMVISTGITVVSNLLLYRSLSKDNLGEIETIDLFQQIPVILLSSFLFADERNFFIIIPALIAAVAIIWSHWEHHHFQIAKKTWPYFIWIILAEPINVAVSKVLLQTWDPISFSLVRAAIRGLVFGMMFHSQNGKVSAKGLGMLFMANLLSSVAWIFFFSSYQHSGVVFTALLLCLQPLMVYAGSLLVLHEKFHWKKAVAFMIILGCILPSQFLK